MNVLLISDDNYAFLLGGCLYSLLYTNTAVKTINVYIISDHISRGSLEKIIEIGKRFDRKIIVVDPPNMSKDIVVKGTLNISTYYRLMLSSVIPDSVDKLLYLDCDVLIRGNLEDLWNTDISEYYLGGVYDTTGKYARKAVGLKRHGLYVNAGVLLINLKKWRKEKIEAKFLKYLDEQGWKVEFNDQGVINHVCSKRIKLVNPKYNFMPTYERYSWRQLKWIVNSDTFYSYENIKESKRNPLIIHFAGYAFSRPWFEGSNIKYGEEFVALLAESGITYSKRTQPNNVKYRIRRCINKMPNTVCVILNKLIDNAYVISERVKTLKK